MLKRLLTVLVALIMAVGLVACAGSTGSGKTGEDAASDTGKQSEETNSEAESEAAQNAPEITFESQTVMEGSTYSVVITGIEAKESQFVLSVEMTNNSSETYTFILDLDQAAVNSVMYYTVFGQDVPAGEKYESYIYLNMDELAELGIDTVTDITLNFTVYGDDFYDKETSHIYPYGEENAVKTEHTLTDSDIVLVDNDDVSVICVGCGEGEESYQAYIVRLYLVNKTDSKIRFYAGNTVLNGSESIVAVSTDVLAGCSRYYNATWSASTLEGLGITDAQKDIESIQMCLEFYSPDTYYSFGTAEVTIEP